MPRHEEHLKDDYSEAKIIVVWSSVEALVGPNILKLRRLMRRSADFAEPARSIYCNLIGITIDEAHRRPITDK